MDDPTEPSNVVRRPKVRIKHDAPGKHRLEELIAEELSIADIGSAEAACLRAFARLYEEGQGTREGTVRAAA